MREPAELSAPLDDSKLVSCPVEADTRNASDEPQTTLMSYDELLYADLHEAVGKLSESIMAELGNQPRRGFKKRRGSRKTPDEPDAV